MSLWYTPFCLRKAEGSLASGKLQVYFAEGLYFSELLYESGYLPVSPPLLNTFSYFRSSSSFESILMSILGAETEVPRVCEMLNQRDGCFSNRFFLLYEKCTKQIYNIRMQFRYRVKLSFSWIPPRNFLIETSSTLRSAFKMFDLLYWKLDRYLIKRTRRIVSGRFISATELLRAITCVATGTERNGDSGRAWKQFRGQD